MLFILNMERLIDGMDIFKDYELNALFFNDLSNFCVLYVIYVFCVSYKDIIINEMSK